MSDLQRLKLVAHRDFIRAMRTGRMMAFVGSMTGTEFGYPKWGDLLRGMIPEDFNDPQFDFCAFLRNLLLGRPAATHDPRWIDAAINKLLDDKDQKSNPLLLLDLLNLASNEEAAQIFNRYRTLFDVAAKNRQTETRNSIWQICRNLGIRRIITTNYDLEFEFELMGDPHLMPDQADAGAQRARLAAAWQKERDAKRHLARRDDDNVPLFDYRIKHQTPDSRVVISDCFHRQRADGLFEFAIGASDRAWHILHLHGRVTDPETMIVTYSDYERQYRTRGISRLPFEHGMNLLYAGNPILFIGLGMSEDDLLRTLREFVGAGYPSHIAPHFVLWSPKSAKGRTVSADDELMRLQFYRQFGVHLLYDVEIARDDEKAYFRRKYKRATLPVSINTLARFAAEHVLPFEWEDGQWNARYQRSVKGDFRDLQALLYKHRHKRSAVVWEIVQNTAKSPSTPAENASLEALITDNMPVKAIIDPPGSGHGYAARWIKAHYEASEDKQTIYLQLNAAFSWELDTTFSAVSGLADGTTAYRKRKSRLQVARELIHQIDSGTYQGNHMCIVINGADRFFDPTGYPLSNELDQLVRMVVSRPFKENYYPTVTLMLLGTARVERYLLSLDKHDASQGNPAMTRPPWLSRWSVQIRGSGDSAIPEFHNRNDAPSPPDRHWDSWTNRAEGRRSAASQLPAMGSVYFEQVKKAFESGEPTVQWSGANRSITWAEHTAIRQSLVSPEVELRRAFLASGLDPHNLANALKLKGKDRRDTVHLALRLLRVMAFIGQPVDVEVLSSAVAASIHHDNQTAKLPKDELVADLMDKLLTARIVMEFEHFPGVKPQGDVKRYGLHRAVLHEIRDRHSIPFSDARNYTSFNIPLATAQPIDDHEPAQAVQGEIEAIIDSLIRDVDAQVRKIAEGNVRITKARMSSISRHLRTVCAALRSYYTTSTLLMHEPDPFPSTRKSPKMLHHAERLGRLIYVAEEFAKICREWSEDPSSDWQPHIAQTFLPDDLVWLHAQRGVALMTQGDLYGARDSLGKATVINNRFVEFGDHSQNWRRIELNQIHIDIERGKLSTAEARIRAIKASVNELVPAASWQVSWLEQTGDKFPQNAFEAIMQAFGMQQRARVRAVSPHFAADIILTVGLACGYRGWCEYLRGRLRTAEHYFKVCIQILRNTGEQRAYALFLRHYASLLHAIGEGENARDMMGLCLAAAEPTRQFDIAHLAAINKADHDLESGESVDRVLILRQLLSTLRYADLTDMYRVRMEAQRVLARMRLQDGDYDGALEQATGAMSVATRFGFTLRKIDLRILIGQILRRRGDPISGDAMFEEAGRIADRVGYQRGVEKAHHARLHPRKNLV